MFDRAINYLIDHKDRQRIAIALGKGCASMHAREVDPRDPTSWEFSGFSQNGEDGIIDVLLRHARDRNRYVLEIGSADGTENNSSWLLLTARYEGLLVEGDPRQSARARRNVARYSIGSECLSLFVTLGSVGTIWNRMARADPDVFSLDIDGNDFHIASELFARGLRPKISVVEYNSAFGPTRSVTSRYSDDFRRTTADPSHLYYGASIGAWQAFFSRLGYRFVTVESSGVNAIFVDPAAFDPSFLDAIEGQGFVENRYQLRSHRVGHEGQFALIEARPLDQV